MKTYIAYNPNFDKEILGSKYADDGPYKHKEYRCWLNIDIESYSYHGELPTTCTMELSEDDIKTFFKNTENFDEWFWYEKKKMREDNNYFTMINITAD